MPSLTEVGREVFVKGNTAIIAKRPEEETEQRTYAICKKDFQPFGNAVRSNKCIVVHCDVGMDNQQRDLNDISCKRKKPFSQVTLIGDAIVDLEKDPFDIPRTAILQYREYERSDVSEFDRLLLEDLQVRGATAFE